MPVMQTTLSTTTHALTTTANATTKLANNVSLKREKRQNSSRYGNVQLNQEIETLSPLKGKAKHVMKRFIEVEFESPQMFI